MLKCYFLVIDMNTVSFDNTSSFLMFQLDTQRSLLSSDVTFRYHAVDDVTQALVMFAVHSRDNSSVAVELVQQRGDSVLAVRRVQRGLVISAYNISLPGRLLFSYNTYHR